MKKFNLISILLIIVSLNATAQRAAINKPVEKCDFLKPLIFKNGKATVTIKATYKNMFRSPDDFLFNKLAKKKTLRYRDYFSSCCGGTSVAFIPENCSNEYTCTMLKSLISTINKVKQGESFYLTLTIFKNVYLYQNMPFFVINHIALEKSKSE